MRKRQIAYLRDTWRFDVLDAIGYRSILRRMWRQNQDLREVYFFTTNYISDASKSLTPDIEDWIAENGISAEVLPTNVHVTEVIVQNENDALLFKLRWNDHLNHFREHKLARRPRFI